MLAVPQAATSQRATAQLFQAVATFWICLELSPNQSQRPETAGEKSAASLCLLLLFLIRTVWPRNRRPTSGRSPSLLSASCLQTYWAITGVFVAELVPRLAWGNDSTQHTGKTLQTVAALWIFQVVCEFAVQVGWLRSPVSARDRRSEEAYIHAHLPWPRGGHCGTRFRRLCAVLDVRTCVGWLHALVAGRGR